MGFIIIYCYTGFTCNNNNNNNNNNNSIIIIIMMMMMMMMIIAIIIYGIYTALYSDAQSALQNFVGDFARLLI